MEFLPYERHRDDFYHMRGTELSVCNTVHIRQVSIFYFPDKNTKEKRKKQLDSLARSMIFLN